MSIAINAWRTSVFRDTILSGLLLFIQPLQLSPLVPFVGDPYFNAIDRFLICKQKNCKMCEAGTGQEITHPLKTMVTSLVHDSTKHRFFSLFSTLHNYDGFDVYVHSSLQIRCRCVVKIEKEAKCTRR